MAHLTDVGKHVSWKALSQATNWVLGGAFGGMALLVVQSSGPLWGELLLILLLVLFATSTSLLTLSVDPDVEFDFFEDEILDVSMEHSDD